jgi:hypothetical protein
MGFDPALIPTIANAFRIARYPIVHGALADVRAVIAGQPHALDALPREYVTQCRPQFGWADVLAPKSHAAAS